MTTPEFSRPFDVRQAEGKAVTLTATTQECAALARRFALVRIARMEAELVLSREGLGVNASGTLSADIVQSCAVSGEDLPVLVREKMTLRFVPQGKVARPDEEIELDINELDEIEFAGSEFDLGEAVAQSLALAIDPFAIGPEAEEARRRAGLLSEGEAGPFAALAKLRKQ